MIAEAGSVVALGWIRAWEAAERGSAPRAGLAAGPPHALWFLALWHLLTAWTWAWGGVGNEAGHEEEGDGWAASAAASAAVCGAVCGAGLEVEAASGVEDDSVGTLMGTEDGFVCALDGTVDEV